MDSAQLVGTYAESSVERGLTGGAAAESPAGRGALVLSATTFGAGRQSPEVMPLGIAG